MRVILSTDISFIDFDNNLVFLPKNTQLFVDVVENIAYYNGTHFDIGSEEYLILN